MNPRPGAPLAAIMLVAGLLAGCGSAGVTPMPAGTAQAPPPASTATPAPTAPAAASDAVPRPLDVVASNAPVVIDDYYLVSSARISRTVFEYTYQVDATNFDTQDLGITARLSSAVASTTVVQGSVDFGNVLQGDTRQSQGTFVLRIDRSVPFDATQLTWSVQTQVLPPTTFQLIDQAADAGTLDQETALVYKVYAEQADSRLPAEYSGRTGPLSEAAASRYAVAHFASLSPATQQLLTPLLQLPVEPIPAAATPAVAPTSGPRAHLATPPALPQNVERTNIEAVPGKVYIYWDKNDPDAPSLAARANALKAELNARIWARLAPLYGVPPDPKKIEVFLEPGAGLSNEKSSDCNIAEVYLTEPTEDFPVVAHEMTHALLDLNFPHQCNNGDYHWMQEATATWSQHFVYPTANSGEEQDSAPDLLDHPELPLDTDDPTHTIEHQYGAYLWFLFLTAGDQSTAVNSNTLKVRNTWAATETLEPLRAVDSIAPGGLNKSFHDFALYNWNRVTDHVNFVAGLCSVSGASYVFYARWDCLRARARESTGARPVAVNLNGKAAAVYPMPHLVKYLAAKYFHYDLSTDSTIRRIRIYHPYFQNNSSGTAKVQVILKLAGGKGWQPAIDVTGRQYTTFCRDESDQNFQEVTVVISNSEFKDTTFKLQDDGGAHPVTTRMQVSALGCNNWKGTVDSSYYSGNPADVINTVTHTEAVTFEKDTEDWTDNKDTVNYKVTGGKVTWKLSETQNAGVPCTGSFTGSYDLSVIKPFEASLTLGGDQPTYAIDAGMQPVSAGGSWNYTLTDYILTCALIDLQPPANLFGVPHWFTTSDVLNDQPPPSLYATGNTPTDLQGQATVHTAIPGEVYKFLWELKSNGTFTEQ